MRHNPDAPILTSEWFVKWAIVGALRKHAADPQVVELTDRFQSRIRNDGSKKSTKAVEELTEELDKHCTVSQPLSEPWAASSADQTVQAVRRREALESDLKFATQYCCDDCCEIKPMAAYAHHDQLKIQAMHSVLVSASTSSRKSSDIDSFDVNVSCKRCKRATASKASQYLYGVAPRIGCSTGTRSILRSNGTPLRDVDRWLC